MSDEVATEVPKVVADFNERLVRMIKEIDSKEFITVLSHPSTLVRVAADQQQQQQQQVRRPV